MGAFQSLILTERDSNISRLRATGLNRIRIYLPAREANRCGNGRLSLFLILKVCRRQVPWLGRGEREFAGKDNVNGCVVEAIRLAIVWDLCGQASSVRSSYEFYGR